MVGATWESVDKHLNAYRARGVIGMEHQQIIIHHRPEQLKARIY